MRAVKTKSHSSNKHGVRIFLFRNFGRRRLVILNGFSAVGTSSGGASAIGMGFSFISSNWFVFGLGSGSASCSKAP